MVPLPGASSRWRIEGCLPYLDYQSRGYWGNKILRADQNIRTVSGHLRNLLRKETLKKSESPGGPCRSHRLWGWGGITLRSSVEKKRRRRRK